MDGQKSVKFYKLLTKWNSVSLTILKEFRKNNQYSKHMECTWLEGSGCRTGIMSPSTSPSSMKRKKEKLVKMNIIEAETMQNINNTRQNCKIYGIPAD